MQTYSWIKPLVKYLPRKGIRSREGKRSNHPRHKCPGLTRPEQLQLSPLWGTSHYAEPTLEVLEHSWTLAWAEESANYTGLSAGLIIIELIKHNCFWLPHWLVWDLWGVLCYILHSGPQAWRRMFWWWLYNNVCWCQWLKNWKGVWRAQVAACWK